MALPEIKMAELMQIDWQRDLSHLPAPENSLAFPNIMTGVAGDLHRTDAGNAEAIVLLYGDKLRFDHTRGKWLIWDKHMWSIDDDGEAERIALSVARERLKSASYIEDTNDRKQAANWALVSESKYRLRSALDLASRMEPITSTQKQFDTNDWLLGCQNGVLDLKTGNLRKGKPEDMLSMTTGFEFDPQARAPRWESFLDEIFDGNNDLIDFIQLACGYSLTGDVSEQCLFILYGSGANGKSTFADVISNLLGDYAGNTSFGTFEASKFDSGRIPNDLAALKGRRFVTASEIKERSRLNEARIKSLSGGDPVTARFLHHEYFTFSPTFKIWLLVNHRPNVFDNSVAFWRRIRLIPFERQFMGQECDKNLKKKLLLELSGILNWAIEGCLAWQKEGLPIPDKVREATDIYCLESDIVKQFLNECTVIKENAKTEASMLYSEFRKWAERNGEYLLSNNMFGRKMKEAGFNTERGKTTQTRKTVYVNIGLLNDVSEDISDTIF